MSPSKLLIRKRSRAARKGEAYIVDYRFPNHIETRVRRRLPELDEAGWRLVEQGLREWFVCCAWRGRAMLGMPSRAVDEAWHEFILDSISYTHFCNAAFGGYLHHTPDEARSASSGDALGETVRAWDRSDMGTEEDSVLWDLDERLGVDRPVGVSGVQLSAARSRAPDGGGAFGCGGGWDGDTNGSGDGGAGCGGGCGGGS